MTINPAALTGAREIETESIRRNPHNPRIFFNEESLDLLRTSIQEVGILVPLIVYANNDNLGEYVLLDGERRWRCALDLGLMTVPANVIPQPSPLDNVLRMFNIHAVREDWPLVSIALSLGEVAKESGETRETRLSEMTGLPRATVRRAKRLLDLPEAELDLIQQEAHLSRADQIHREDLYLEIDAAESVLRNRFPEIAKSYTRDQIIRNFAHKREIGSLKSVTDFRTVGKIASAADGGLVSRPEIVKALRALVEDPQVTPSRVFDELLASSYEQKELNQKSQTLLRDLEKLQYMNRITDDLRNSLVSLGREIERLLAGLR